MAGIGYELKKMLDDQGVFGVIRTYTFAGIISSGPWVLSIVGVFLLGLFSITGRALAWQVTEVQTSITYLIAFSLISSGVFQQSFTRFVADELFLHRYGAIVENFNTLILLLTIFSGVLGYLIVVFTMAKLTLYYQLLMIAGFVLLNNIWVATILLSGLKEYKQILINFFIGYFVAVVLGVLLRHWGRDGILFAFVFGQLLLFVGMYYLIYNHYVPTNFLAFDFLNFQSKHYWLMASGFFYNLGIWADKFVFWFHANTGVHVVGPLYASTMYDLPIFLAYLSIIPGMAVFLVRVETDFNTAYQSFYHVVREGGSLNEIHHYRNDMVVAARSGIMDIVKIQGITVLCCFLAGPYILSWLGISQMYYHLFAVDVLAVGLQVVFLSVLNIFFYLDKLSRAAILSFIFCVSNYVFSLFSIHLGAFYFGYGFASAVLLVLIIGFWWLDRDFHWLEFETFMLAQWR